MKTKVFLLLCLFIGIATVMSSAQDNSNRATQGWSTYSDRYFPIFCNGEVVDVLHGDIDFHYVNRGFKNGSPYLETDQLRGKLVSEATGETFKARATEKFEFSPTWVLTFTTSYNFIGDMGTIYTGKIFFDYSTNPEQITFVSVLPSRSFDFHL